MRSYPQSADMAVLPRSCVAPGFTVEIGHCECKFGQASTPDAWDRLLDIHALQQALHSTELVWPQSDSLEFDFTKAGNRRKKKPKCEDVYTNVLICFPQGCKICLHSFGKKKKAPKGRPPKSGPKAVAPSSNAFPIGVRQIGPCARQSTQVCLFDDTHDEAFYRLFYSPKDGEWTEPYSKERSPSSHQHDLLSPASATSGFQLISLNSPSSASVAAGNSSSDDLSEHKSGKRKHPPESR